MSRYTVLRVEVDSGVVKRILDATPGVDVVEDADAESPDRRPADRTDDVEPLDTDDEGGLSSKLPDEDSAVRQYGLLGVGVSFVLLGVATVGIWWYRRRSGSAEADAHAEFDRATETDDDTEFEPTVDTPTISTDDPLGTDESTSAPRADTDDDLTLTPPSGEDATDERDEADAEPASRTVDDDAEPAGRTEDRDEVEWTTKRTDEPEPTADETDDADEEAAPTPDARTGGSIDVAPLLGVAFIAISGAVVRWIQGDDEQSD